MEGPAGRVLALRRAMRLEHFVMTRFAVKSPGSGFRDEFPSGWLEGRFDLFERYCLPTMRAQTQQDFRWLLYCHADFEPENESRLLSMWDKIEVVKGRGGLHYFVDGAAEAVISTRLDSDDGLHREALERVQGHLEDFRAAGYSRWLHNFPRGYKLATREGRLYRCRKLNSQFLSLFELNGGDEPVQGALRGNHSTMIERFPHGQDETLDGWLMVVHGGNVVNQVASADEEVDVGVLRDGFPDVRLDR